MEDKAVVNARSKKWREKNKEKAKAYAEDYRADHKDYMKDYYAEHVVEMKKKGALYRETHSDQIRFARVGKRDENIQRNKKWRGENKDYRTVYSKKYREISPEKCSSWGKEWKKLNPGKVAAYNARRRAAKMNQTPTWFEKDRCEAVYKKCIELNNQWGTKFEVDHIYPLQGKKVSGLHCHANLQILDKQLNCKKLNSPTMDE